MSAGDLYGLHFDAASWLALLPLAWLLLWLAERRGRARLSVTRRRLTRMARWLAVACVVAALAETTAWRREDRLSVVFAIDASRSMAADGIAIRTWLDEAAALRPERDRAGIVVFGGEAMVERYPAEDWTSAGLSARPDPDGTDLGGAVTLSRSLFPPGDEARLVLLTDGRETASDLERTLARLPDNVDVGWVPLASAERPEVLIDQVIAPDRVVEGQPHRFRVVARATHAGEATLRVYRGSTPIGASRVRLEPGRPNVFTIEQASPDGAGAVVYRAEIEADDDRWVENNRGAAVVRVEGRPHVLLVDRDPATLAPLRRSLERAGMEVVAGPPSALPADPLRLHAFDAVLLADAPATGLSDRLLSRVGDYVQSGGGLLMLGGPDSFGAGGYWRSPLEPVLPLDMDVKDRSDLPSVGLVLCIDKSGSMAGYGAAAKIDVAKAAAVEVVRALGPIDRVGVVGFDAAAKWVAPLQPAGDPSGLIDGLGTLRAGGGTDAYPALLLAEEALAGSEVRVKHTILVTDGQLQARDHEGLAERMQRAGITVSTVAIGSDADYYTLERIARTAGGHAYVAEDIARVPRIFLREAFRVSRSWLVEEAFVPRRRGSHPALAGIDVAAMPPLGGYVAASEKPGAQHLLATHRDDPLFSVWHYGVGRSAAFTSDAKARWGSAWLKWDGYERFWSRIVRWTARSSPVGSRVQAQMEVQGGRLEIGADVMDRSGGFLNGAEIVATVIGPDAQRRDVVLRQTGPGRYSAGVPASTPGPWFAALRVGSGDASAGEPLGAAVTAVVPYSREFATLRSDADALERLVAEGRVRRIETSEEIWSHRGTGSRLRWPLASWLFAAAAGLLVLEVGARRLHLERRPPRPQAPPNERLDRLQAARRRVRRPSGSQAPLVATSATAAPERPERSPGEDEPAAEPAGPEAAPDPPVAEPHTSRLLRARRRRGRDRS